ncbi:MAG TPA: hypothetical protein VN969_45265 [Streptosporangiaceae bacterium]|nr:hypothetical protein [Streptosporangiaceae bacterium]
MSLFAGLLDDAAVFPPGNAPLPAALAAHRDHHAAWYAELVGPFVFPAARLGELDGTAPFPGGLSLTAAADGLSTAVDAGGLSTGFRPDLVAVEAVPAPDGVPGLVRLLDSVLPAGVTGYVEIPRGPGRDAALDALAGTRYLAKFRTGGVVPEAHPGERELAETILAAVSRGIPFKCTAGLHHAVRHTDGDLEQHGFLNVLLATSAALDGADTGDLAAVLAALLAERSPAVVAAAVDGMSHDQMVAARTRFLSFGTCSIDDPVADLVALGLLSKPVS